MKINMEEDGNQDRKGRRRPGSSAVNILKSFLSVFLFYFYVFYEIQVAICLIPQILNTVLVLYWYLQYLHNDANTRYGIGIVSVSPILYHGVHWHSILILDTISSIVS